jgi:oxidase EvaA
MTSQVTLEEREDSALPGRLARSALAACEGADIATDAVSAWFAERIRAHHFQVNRIPFSELQNWSFEERTGNLTHDSGQFFSVQGVHVRVSDVDGAMQPEWQQPIIVQPEIGILGILAKEIDGVLHFYMQAKMEPGNPNLLQLSPTVQATFSNYTQVHNGGAVRYLEYFTDPSRGRVLVDVLQSEHGSWFLRKSNRNMVIEALDEVPPHEDFRWLTLGQIGQLLRRDNVVNMDARTVLACIPADHVDTAAMSSDTVLLSWFTAERARHSVQVETIPLARVDHWTRDANSISHVPDWFFRVVAVAVEAGNREVHGWTQPLFEPIRVGVTAYVVRMFCGVMHLLVHARVEGGFLDTVELGPTVQYTPEYYSHLTGASRPPFLDVVLAADSSRIRYEAVHSEEGGRFLNAENRYLIVEADATEVPDEPPRGYLWVTPAQLSSLVRHGHYVNVQARTLLAVLNTRATTL